MQKKIYLFPITLSPESARADFGVVWSFYDFALTAYNEFYIVFELKSESSICQTASNPNSYMPM